MKNNITLLPLSLDDAEQFIADTQAAFKYAALEEFGRRDDHIDNEGEIISYNTIKKSLNATGNKAYRIINNGKIAGGVILKIDEKTQHNHLEIFFIFSDEHSKGIGYAAWQKIEALFPQTKIWETFTPYFEKRNIHFYINKCGFQAVEFFGEFHPFLKEDNDENDGPEEMLRFIKIMK